MAVTAKPVRYLTILMIVAIQGISLDAWADQTSATCSFKWSAFFKAPTQSSYKSLSGTGCDKNTLISDDDLIRLIHLTENGNKYGAYIISENRKNLDGGNLEDVDVAIGQFADRRPKDFLMMKKANRINDYGFSSAISRLPLNLSDKIDLQEKAMEQRKLKILSINSPELETEKRSALIIIDNALEEIRRHK